jgi:hypothetical protein
MRVEVGDVLIAEYHEDFWDGIVIGEEYIVSEIVKLANGQREAYVKDKNGCTFFPASTVFSKKVIQKKKE